MSAGERKKGACGMIYFAITAAVFTLDFFLKKYID
ncbi:signal peptidase II, partial [Soehngenia saccharolytica]